MSLKEDDLGNERAGRGCPIIVNLLIMERGYREMGNAWSDKADIMLEAAIGLKRLERIEAAAAG